MNFKGTPLTLASSENPNHSDEPLTGFSREVVASSTGIRIRGCETFRSDFPGILGNLVRVEAGYS